MSYIKFPGGVGQVVSTKGTTSTVRQLDGTTRKVQRSSCESATAQDIQKALAKIKKETGQ